MENTLADCIKIKNADIVKFWLENNRKASNVISWISTKFQKDANDDCMVTVKKKINNFCAQANQKWAKNKRCAKKFEKKERSWLSYVTELKLSKSDDTKLLVHAASIADHASHENDLSLVLKEAASPPSSPTKMRKLLTSDNAKPIPLSPAEALVFLRDNNLTKRQYINIRELNKSHNCDIYPSYKTIQEHKLQCRPEGHTMD